MNHDGLASVEEQNRTTEAPSAEPTLQEDHRPRSASQQSPNPQAAKTYSRIKLTLGITQTILFFALTIIVLAAGITQWMEQLVRELVSNDYVVLLGFGLLFGIAESVVGFPLKFYSGFYLEHQYNLSNQTFLVWLREGAKGMLVGIPMMIPVLLALFYSLRTFGEWWWLPVGVLLFLFSVVLARVAPVLIFPLFYKFKPLEDGSLKERILTLCSKVGMQVAGVFVFDMSKNTKKANAAFTGIGKSKRIVLGDTLVANFTDEEIETVFAHELGHYKLNHIWISMGFGTVSTFAGLYLTALLFSASLEWFGFTSPDTIAALPLLGLWLGVYSLVTSPLGNMISRAHERAADRFAIRLTGKKEPFVNALKKLANVNLADTAPHPVVEFLFHSHPSINRRVKFVEAL